MEWLALKNKASVCAPNSMRSNKYKIQLKIFGHQVLILKNLNFLKIKIWMNVWKNGNERGRLSNQYNIATLYI